MQQRQRIFGLQDVLALLAVISLTAVQMTGFARDPGVGWHLANGEYVLKHETVPQTDPFLLSPHPRPWVSDQWLADVLLFTAYAAGAWPLVYGFLAATYLATFYAILYPTTVRLTGAPLMAATFTLLAFKLGQLHFILRPVIFGFFCFAILCALIWRREISLRTTATSKRWIVPFEIYLLPLFVVWANLHPSFVLGLLLLALRGLGVVLNGTAQRNTATILSSLGARIRELLCGVLGSCINPNGIELHRSIVALGSDRFFMTYHEEWLPPDPTNSVGLVLLVTCLIGSISLLTERKPRSFSSFELLVFLIFGYLAFSSVRMVPFFGIVMAVPLGGESHRYRANEPGVARRSTARVAWTLFKRKYPVSWDYHDAPCVRAPHRRPSHSREGRPVCGAVWASSRRISLRCGRIPSKISHSTNSERRRRSPKVGWFHNVAGRRVRTTDHRRP